MNRSLLEHSLWWQIGLTCAGSALAFADFAEYSIYIFVVPLAVLLLLSALFFGLAGYKSCSQSMKTKIVSIVCMLTCAVQLPDMLFRRLPAALSDSYVADKQASRAKAFEAAIEKESKQSKPDK
jgi:hypothetical protein